MQAFSPRHSVVGGSHEAAPSLSGYLVTCTGAYLHGTPDALPGVVVRLAAVALWQLHVLEVQQRARVAAVCGEAAAGSLDALVPLVHPAALLHAVHFMTAFADADFTGG
jgi:hypothetical protein